jgi:hypothetical protein
MSLARCTPEKENWELQEPALWLPPSKGPRACSIVRSTVSLSGSPFHRDSPHQSSLTFRQSHLTTAKPCKIFSAFFTLSSPAAMSGGIGQSKIALSPRFFARGLSYRSHSYGGRVAAKNVKATKELVRLSPTVRGAELTMRGFPPAAKMLIPIGCWA